MTPSKKDKTTTIRIEKIKRTSIDVSQIAHKAGGQHSGLVINKQAIPGSDLFAVIFTCDGFFIVVFHW